MDIDMSGRIDNDEENIKSCIKEIITIELEPDGLVYISDSIETERITEDADYHGLRIRFEGTLDTVRFKIQIDIGFGDVIFPEPEEIEVASMLDMQPIHMLGYSRESFIAEKYEAMVKLGELNSRMKDFYDIWVMSRQYEFDGQILAEAVKKTFEQRGRELLYDIPAFTSEFIVEKSVQWKAFRNKLTQEYVPADFEEIIIAIKEFLYPPVYALHTGVPFEKKWESTGMWV
jgi:hypothetical protein